MRSNAGGAGGGGGAASAEDSLQRNFALHSAPSSPMRALQQQHSQAFFGGGGSELHARHMAPNGPFGGHGGANQAQALGRHDRSRSFTSLGGLAAASHAQHQAQQQLFAHQQAHQQAAQQSHKSQQALAAAIAQNPFKALSAVFAPHQLAALAAANGARHRLQVRVRLLLASNRLSTRSGVGALSRPGTLRAKPMWSLLRSDYRIHRLLSNLE